MDSITILGATAVAGASVALARSSRDRKRRLDRIRALQQDGERPCDVSHLTLGLGRVVRQARMVRLVLETPLQRFHDLPDTPWGRRQRCDEYDLALSNARYALWEWLGAVDRLTTADRALLRQLGVGPAPLRCAIFKPGVFDRTNDVFEEVLYPSAPNLETVADELCRIVLWLKRFEAALLSYRPDPYR